MSTYIKKYPGSTLSRQFSCSGLWITHNCDSSLSHHTEPNLRFLKTWPGFEPATSDPWGRAHTTEPQIFAPIVLELIFHPSTCTRTMLSHYTSKTEVRLQPNSLFCLRLSVHIEAWMLRSHILPNPFHRRHDSTDSVLRYWWIYEGFQESPRETVIQIQTDH